MLKINIRTKPIQRMRYSTLGDYYWMVSPVPEENILKIVVAEMDNSDDEFLIALHELIEAYLVEKKDLSYKEIDEWDLKVIKEKGENIEPGEVKGCPYAKEHRIALKIEKIMEKYLKRYAKSEPKNRNFSKINPS
jgi:hypothetical protein